jgi:SAM-dependent methyltransferase
MDGRRYRLELALRRALPEPVKAAGRALRLMLQPVPPPAPAVPQHLLDGCRLLADREAFLDHVPPHSRICELGTYRGDFARVILARAHPRELHLVDVSFAICAGDVLTHPAVITHATTTAAFLTGAEPESFDLIYVDADHSHAAVSADIIAAMDRVRPGGLLAFNDFARIVRPGLGVFGVHQAVCEFMVRSGWPMVFFCLHGEALYDVVLRRPIEPDRP